MTIIKDGSERAIECDRCPETTDPMDKDDFRQMVAIAIADGWKIELVNGEYSHLCPGCKSDSRLAAAQRMFT